MSFFKFNLNAYYSRYFTQLSDPEIQTRAINILNIFRLGLSLTFIFFYLYIGKENWWNIEDAPLFFHLSVAYLIFSVVALAISALKSLASILIQPVQIIVDIAFIILLMSSAGGIQSGFGLLLIITIVIASLISNGRLALFYAAIASISLLLEQSYQILNWGLPLSSYTQPVMLGLSCFATAWLAYSLAKRMQHSEELASARGIDLENLAQINALITQEMHDGILVVDQDLYIRHHNLQAESLLLLHKHKAETMTLTATVPQIASTFIDWTKGGDTHGDVIIPMNNRELKLRFMPINELRSQGAVIFIEDWSQIQAAAQQAKLAALGRLTANIAHEIRNPLSAISHANQLLQEEHITEPTGRILQIISDNIQRIDQIIKDVLELNRRDRTHQEQIALHQFLVDFHAQFSAIEKISADHFSLILDHQNPTILFDHRHLTQILWNLCKNGWQHSRKQSASLSLRCFTEGNSGFYLEIKDDGDGVNEQDRARLFEPFFTTKQTGNGLGLYISRELAEANGASLHYQALAEGSAFLVHLKKSG
jgi:two-component system sensor histidine kinase PilS (NtrC family)